MNQSLAPRLAPSTSHLILQCLRRVHPRTSQTLDNPPPPVHPCSAVSHVRSAPVKISAAAPEPHAWCSQGPPPISDEVLRAGQPASGAAPKSHFGDCFLRPAIVGQVSWETDSEAEILHVCSLWRSCLGNSSCEGKERKLDWKERSWALMQSQQRPR